jgi:hypothetical protein
MSTSVIGGDSASVALLQQRRNTLKAAESDAQDGAAQAGFAAFQQLAPSPGAASAPSTATTQNAASATNAPTSSVASLRSDLTSLLNAALAGDSSSLETSGSAVQSDLQALGLSTGQNTSSSSSSSASSSSANSFTSDLDALIGEAQSGSVAGAQKAAQTLVQDMGGQTNGVAGAHHGHGHHGHGAGQASDSLTPTADQLIDPTGSVDSSAATEAETTAGGLPQYLLDALGDGSVSAQNSGSASAKSNG